MNVMNDEQAYRLTPPSLPQIVRSTRLVGVGGDDRIQAKGAVDGYPLRLRGAAVTGRAPALWGGSQRANPRSYSFAGLLFAPIPLAESQYRGIVNAEVPAPPVSD
jgi:hypothetical protein